MLAPNPVAAARAAGAPGRGTERLPSARRDLDGVLLQLQRSHGNQFVQRLVARSATAPGLLSQRGGPDVGLLAAEEPAAAPAAPLVVGAAHDPAEAAADRIAGTVAGSWPAAAGPGLAMPAGGPLIHRRAADGDPGGSLDGETSRAVGAAQRAGGVPLGAAARSRMESVLGTGLPGVRVHADATARDLCDTIRAHAFTVGQHIFFRRGLPDLGSAAGRHLLAHELAHITQQSPPAVIRRTYLDSGEDWKTSTTRRGVTGAVKDRSAALRLVDRAVVAVRRAYNEGYLPVLSEDLQTLLERIAEWRRAGLPWSGRMRRAAVDALTNEATDLKDQVDRWQGIAFTRKRQEHQQQLVRVTGWLNEGSRSQDVRLRNSVDWVRRGKAKLYVLTETADREYRARFLLGRKPTDKEATYFPNPDSGSGALGEGTAFTHMYNPADATDQKNVLLNRQISGWNRNGYIAVTNTVTGDDVLKQHFFQTLRHEVQHDADKHRGPELSRAVDTAQPGPKQKFQKALREYKTEYRAHSYQGGPALTVPAGADRRGRRWAPGQFEVFEHIRADYPTIETAVGGSEPTQEQSRFITKARAYQNPDTEGFNKYNSARIDDLYLALSNVTPHTADVTDNAVVEVLRAARALHISDVAYIRAGSEGVEAPEEAFMLRDMIWDRLDGAARGAFIATVRQIRNRAFDPPRIARPRRPRREAFPAFHRPA